MKSSSRISPDTHTVLALAVGFQCLPLVARRDAPAGEFRGGMNLKQLASRDALEIAEGRYGAAAKQGLGIDARA